VKERKKGITRRRTKTILVITMITTTITTTIRNPMLERIGKRKEKRDIPVNSVESHIFY